MSHNPQGGTGAGGRGGGRRRELAEEEEAEEEGRASRLPRFAAEGEPDFSPRQSPRDGMEHLRRVR